MTIRELFRRLLGRPNIATIMDNGSKTIIYDKDNGVYTVLHWDDAHKLIASEVYDAAK